MKVTQPINVTVYDKKLKRDVNQRVFVTIDIQAAALAAVRKAVKAPDRRAKLAGGIISVLAG